VKPFMVLSTSFASSSVKKKKSFMSLAPVVGLVGSGQDCDEHGDGAVAIQKAEDEEDSPGDNKPRKRSKTQNIGPPRLAPLRQDF